MDFPLYVIAMLCVYVMSLSYSTLKVSELDCSRFCFACNVSVAVEMAAVARIIADKAIGDTRASCKGWCLYVLSEYVDRPCVVSSANTRPCAQEFP